MGKNITLNDSFKSNASKKVYVINEYQHFYNYAIEHIISQYNQVIESEEIMIPCLTDKIIKSIQVISIDLKKISTAKKINSVKNIINGHGDKLIKIQCKKSFYTFQKSNLLNKIEHVIINNDQYFQYVCKNATTQLISYLKNNILPEYIHTIIYISASYKNGFDNIKTRDDIIIENSNMLSNNINKMDEKYINALYNAKFNPKMYSPDQLIALLENGSLIFDNINEYYKISSIKNDQLTYN